MLIIELICPEQEVRRRILNFDFKKHERLGDAKSWLRLYKKLKKDWKPIKKVHFVIDSSRDINKQLDLFITQKIT